MGEPTLEQELEALIARGRQMSKGSINGKSNVGLDPELLVTGIELAEMEIEDGVRKFSDFCKKMIDEIGEEIRPYLKQIYNNTRDILEESEDANYVKLASEMDDYGTVKEFNVKNFVRGIKEDINNQSTEDNGKTFEMAKESYRNKQWALMRLELMEDYAPKELKELIQAGQLEASLNQTQEEMESLTERMRKSGLDMIEANEVARGELLEEYLYNPKE